MPSGGHGAVRVLRSPPTGPRGRPPKLTVGDRARQPLTDDMTNGKTDSPTMGLGSQWLPTLLTRDGDEGQATIFKWA